MKKTLFFFLFSIFIYASNEFAQDPDKIIVRDDNDIATFRDTISPKEIMPADLKTRISDLLSIRCKELAEACDTNSLYFQSYKINAGEEDCLYVVELNESIHGFQLYLSLYNAAANSYSGFFNIDGSNMYNNEEGFDPSARMIEKPYISFSDLNGDGRKEILFNRRAHNGTWNAVETIALKTGDDGNLKKFFSFYSKEFMFADPQVLATRKIKSVGRTSVVLTVEYLDPATGKIIRKSDLVKIEK